MARVHCAMSNRWRVPADVDQHLGGGPGRRLRFVEQLHGRPVRVAQPQAVLGGAGRRLDDRGAGPLQRLADRVHGARPDREADVVQPFDGRLHQPHLLLVTAGAHGHQGPVLFAGFQAEILQEAFGHRQVGDFQRVVVQP